MIVGWDPASMRLRPPLAPETSPTVLVSSLGKMSLLLPGVRPRPVQIRLRTPRFRPFEKLQQVVGFRREPPCSQRWNHAPCVFTVLQSLVSGRSSLRVDVAMLATPPTSAAWMPQQWQNFSCSRLNSPITVTQTVAFRSSLQTFSAGTSAKTPKWWDGHRTG